MESDSRNEDIVLSALNNGNPHAHVARAPTGGEQYSSIGNGHMRGSFTIQEDTASSEPYNIHERDRDIMVDYKGDLGHEAVRSCGRDMLVNVDYEQARVLTRGRRLGTEDKLQMQPSNFGVPDIAEQEQEDGEKHRVSNVTAATATSTVARPSLASGTNSVESCKSKDSMCSGAKNSARKIMVSNLPRHSRRSKSKEINWLRDTLSLTSSTHSEFISTSMHSGEIKAATQDGDELQDSHGEFGCAINCSGNRMNGSRHSNKSARSGSGGQQRNASSPGFLESQVPSDLLPSEAPRHGPLPAILACSVSSQSEVSTEKETEPIPQCNKDCEQCELEPGEEEKEEVPFKWITATISKGDQEELPPPPPRDSPNSPRSKRWERETEDIPDPTPRSVTPPKNAPMMPRGGYGMDVISDGRRGPPSTRGARIPASGRERPNRHHSNRSHRDPREETHRPPLGHRRNTSDLGDYSAQSHRSNRRPSPSRQGGSISGSSRYQRDRSPDRPSLPDMSRSGYLHRRSMSGSVRHPREISDISRSGYSHRDRSPSAYSRRDRSPGGYSRREGSPERYSRRDSSPGRRPSLRDPSPHRRVGEDRSVRSRRPDPERYSTRESSPVRHSSLRDPSPHRRGGDDRSVRSRRPDEGSLYPSLRQQRDGEEDRSFYTRRPDEGSLYSSQREQRHRGEDRSVYTRRPEEAPSQREHRGGGEDRSFYSRRPDDRSAYPPPQRGGGERGMDDRLVHHSRQHSRGGEDGSMYSRRVDEHRRGGDEPSLYPQGADDRSAYQSHSSRQQRGGGDDHSRRMDDRSGDRPYADRRREEPYEQDFSRRSYGEDGYDGHPRGGHGRSPSYGHDPRYSHSRDRSHPDVYVRSSSRHPSHDDDPYHRDSSRYHHEDDSRRRGAYDGYPEHSLYEGAHDTDRHPRSRDNRRRDRSDGGRYSRPPHEEDCSGRDAWYGVAPRDDGRYERPRHEADGSAGNGRYGAPLHNDGRYDRPPREEDRSARDRRYEEPPNDDGPYHGAQRDEDRGAREGRHQAPSEPPQSEPSPQDDEGGWMDQEMLHEKLLNSGMSTKVSEGTEEEQVYVDISPGVKLPLRRTHETMQAIAMDFYQSVCCVSCSKDVLCIADVCYVICPNCRVISPVVGEYFEGREVHRHGLGLGFTCESLFKMQNEIMQDRSKYEKKETKTPAKAPASEFTYQKLKPASISTSHY